MTEIYSEKLKIVNNAIKAEKVSPKEMTIMGELEGKELAELVQLCESDKSFYYMMKIYLTAYDTKCTLKAEEYTQADVINSILAKVWYETAINETPDNLCEAYMGFSLVGTDLPSRIRAGLKNKVEVNEFDSQIENLIGYLCAAIGDNEFYNVFTASNRVDDLKDTDYIKNRNDTVDYVFSFRDAVLKARDVYKYNDTVGTADKLGAVDRIAFDKLKRKISSWTPEEFKRVSFLNKELIADFIISEEDEKLTAEVIIEDEEETSGLFDEVEEEGLVEKISHKLKGMLQQSDAKKSKEINKPKTFRDLKIDSDKKNNSSKLLLGGIIVIIVVGVLFIMVTRAKDGDVLSGDKILSERKPISVEDIKINDNIEKEVNFIEEE